MPKSRGRKKGKKRTRVKASASPPPPAAPEATPKRPRWWRGPLLWLGRLLAWAIWVDGLFSLAKDSLGLMSWISRTYREVFGSGLFARIVASGFESAVELYRSVVWPAFAWIAQPLRDAIIVVVAAQLPGAIAMIWTVYRTWRHGEESLRRFRWASATILVSLCAVGLLLSSYPPNDPGVALSRQLVVFLVPLQLIRFFQYRAATRPTSGDLFRATTIYVPVGGVFVVMAARLPMFGVLTAAICGVSLVVVSALLLRQHLTVRVGRNRRT